MDGPTPWSLEMQDISILFEHVDLLHTADSSDVQLLQSSLEFSVVSLGSRLGLFHDFTSGCTFSACIGNAEYERTSVDRRE